LVANISREVLAIKYSLLPYYYTLFWEAHMNGSTVAQPLFFQFPNDVNVLSLDKQFLIGDYFLISPVLEQGATSVNAYFPAGRWYDWYSYIQLPTLGWNTLAAPLDKINLHLRGGGVIPTQMPALTTAAARLNPFSLIVMLDEHGRAQGTLYLDDGESLYPETTGAYTYIEYLVASSQLVSILNSNGYAPASKLILNSISVLGVPKCPSQVNLNGASVPFSCSPDVLAVEASGFKVPINAPLFFTWR